MVHFLDLASHVNLGGLIWGWCVSCVGLLQHVWDPISATQTMRVVSLIRQLAEDYPTVSAESKATQVREGGVFVGGG